ncbi:hypothetical protein ACM26V_03600 [Salipaludibacillus sp. HK11]|uniref:hypothetical protein n=1 Tax=Salipaludibacillus sp. HK11 TaxID=3394320 RepID=UPI0039FC3243
MKSKKIKVTILVLITAVSSVGIFLMFYGVPINISSNVTAFEFLPDETNNGEEISVYIDGVYKNPVLGKSTFSGSIQIDKYSLTESYEMFDLSFESPSFVNMATLSYTSVEEGKLMLEMFGNVWLSDDVFDRFIIILNENTQLGIAQGTTIAVPAQNYSEAIRLFEKINQ